MLPSFSESYPSLLKPLLGLGFLFMGIHFLGQSLRGMLGQQLRGLLRTWGRTSGGASLLGLHLGIIAPSALTATYMMVNTILAGFFPLRKAISVVLWANIGVCLLGLLVSIHVALVAVYCTGILILLASLGSANRVNVSSIVGCLIGTFLLWGGIQWAPSALAQAFHSLPPQTPLSAWMTALLGFSFSSLIPTSLAAPLLAVSLMRAHLLVQDSVWPFVCASLLGMGLHLLLQGVRLTGAARQLTWLQASARILPGIIFGILWIVERCLGFRGPCLLLEEISPHTALQVALALLLLQGGSSLCFTFLAAPVARLFKHPTQRSESEPYYLYPQAVCQPQTALVLIHLEQIRLLRALLNYCPYLVAPQPDLKSINRLHYNHQTLNQHIEAFITQMMDQAPLKEVLEASLNLQNRSQILKSLDEHFFEIAYQQLPEELPTALSDFRTNLNEGLHTILLTLIEALEQGDPMDLTFVQQMTGNKSSLSALIHSKILKAHPNLSHKEQELLFTLTGRFERLSWLLGQLGKLARKHRFGQGSPQYRLPQAQQPAV